MAEVVGLVASVVTLGERTTKVVKLKSLWDKVRNVPEDIQSQLDELEALNILITEVEAEAAAEQDALRDTPAGALSLRYCKKAAKELEDSKRLPECTASAFLARKNEVNTEKVKHTPTPTNIASASVELVSPQQATLRWLSGSVFGGITSAQCSQVVQEGRDDGEEVRTRIRLPSWVAQAAWDILTYRSSRGFTWKLTSWNVVPGDSPILEAVKRGPFTDVMAPISSGDASLYDRDDNGKTLLHVSPQPRWEEEVHDNVRSLLDDVSRSGVRLEEYGRVEFSQFMNNGFARTRRYRNVMGYNHEVVGGPYLVSLQYGPRPEDWRFFWDNLVEE
ncbi:hypothetical protein X797_005454 [Metarhizium robertsii]|uniref:Uncharacterized protein n=1 Tax=Metarhizium robertsii TaxID=568076 RepID=A0A014R1B8_9HYPO|nr:hypothetical protein X797_005454 [Metarhizium robertsii]